MFAVLDYTYYPIKNFTGLFSMQAVFVKANNSLVYK